MPRQLQSLRRSKIRLKEFVKTMRGWGFTIMLLANGNNVAFIWNLRFEFIIFLIVCCFNSQIKSQDVDVGDHFTYNISLLSLKII